MPTIAIVDSGIQARADFGSRVAGGRQAELALRDTAGDSRGHGTFVAGIAAGDAPGYAGGGAEREARLGRRHGLDTAWR